MECNFSEPYHPTKLPQTYYKSVGLNERLYQLAIIDLPFVLRNAKDLSQEWEILRGPNAAHAYVFVIDLTCEESFGHVRRLRDQMHEVLQTPSVINGSTVNNNITSNGHPASFNAIPLIVMGNKYDILFANRGHLSRRYQDVVNIIRKQWKWHYVECSAKYNWQIQQSFKTLTGLIDSKLYGTRVGGAERLIPEVLRRNRCALS